MIHSLLTNCIHVFMDLCFVMDYVLDYVSLYFIVYYLKIQFCYRPFLLVGPNVVRDVNDTGRKEEPTLEY